MISWKVISASTPGIENNQPKSECQDFLAHYAREDSFIAIISDGAGSALLAKTGAQTICEAMISELKPYLNNPQKAKKEINEIIGRARIKIEKLASKNKTYLSDYHATLVGVIANPNYGFFFHIGDGAGLCSQDVDFDDFIISKPENGDFINETFFITMENWEEHLHIKEFEKPRYICLMSDGLTGFTLSNDCTEIKTGFLAPISRFLDNNEPSYGSKALLNTISSSNAHNINSDDKSIIWAKFED